MRQAPSYAFGVRLSWPLTGRSEEMRTIEAAMVASDVSGILVSGAAGVGKSRIVREAMSALAPRGYDGRWAVGTSSGRLIPLGAFNAWVPPGRIDTVDLLRGVIASLTAAPSGARVVVGVDDVHLLDELSTFVVHQIVQRGAAKVILTVRDGESISPAIQDICRVGRFDRLDLQPLSGDASAALLSAILGGPATDDAAERLWRLTRGNVLYLRNIVEQEVAEGRFVEQNGRWRWIGDPVIPPGLVELIESRIGALPASVGDVIDALAVGEPIELAALTRITDPAAVEEADTRGLLTLEPVSHGIEVRVSHPLYGEVRRTRAPITRLRRLRGLVAAELAASESRDDIPVVVRRAALGLESDREPDTDLLVRGAHGAVWLANLPLAERLADAAIRAGARPEANLIRAHALSWLGRGTEAEAVLADTSVGALADLDHARLAFLRASNMLWALGDPDRAKEIIDASMPTATGHARSYVDAFLTVYWFAIDQPEASLRASEPLAVAELPAVVGAEVAWTLAAIHADAGRTTEAIAAAKAGYAAADRSLDAPHMRFNIADAHLSALLLAGRIVDAGEVAEHARREAADLPGAAQLVGAAVAGRAELGAGRVDVARTSLERAAVGLFAAGHASGWGYRYQVSLATALAMGGSTGEAAAALAAIDGVARQFRSLDYDLTTARAWVAAGQGVVTEAITLLHSAAERASAKGQFAAEVYCRQTATQFGDRTGVARLRELETIVEGPRVGLAARFAAALREGDGAELCSLSEDFEQVGDLTAAVDAASHAAIAYRRQDLRGSTLSCAARAQDLAEQCGGLDTPALREAAEPLPFTEREREVVTLLGEGLSSRDIAERLTLSVRTVESHIYRAMSKTGTTNREELAALRARRGSRPTQQPSRRD